MFEVRSFPGIVLIYYTENNFSINLFWTLCREIVSNNFVQQSNIFRLIFKLKFVSIYWKFTIEKL